VISVRRKEKASAQLELSCRADEDGYQVVRMVGELDIATAEQAYSYISDVIDAWEQAQVSMDLSGLTFCDASGLGVLARLASHARAAGRQIRLTSPRPSLVKIMRITGLDHVYPELRPAVAAYAGLTGRNAKSPPPDSVAVTMDDAGRGR
jgi:anti-sigma B factor antagonist